jgi:hypothetical protein
VLQRYSNEVYCIHQEHSSDIPGTPGFGLTKAVSGANIIWSGKGGAESPSVLEFFGNFYASDAIFRGRCVARKAARPGLVYEDEMYGGQPIVVSERTEMKLDVSRIPETGLGVNVELDAGEVDISDG